MPNKSVKVLPTGISVQIRSTYYARKMQCQRGGLRSREQDKGGGSTQECFPLFKGPGIEGGILCMGTLPSFLGSFVKGTPPLCVHWLCFTHKPFKLGICVAPSWWLVAKVRLKNS